MNDKPDDCGDGDRRIDSETTVDLQANRFGLEADDLEGDDIEDRDTAAAQLQADRYAEEVARRWGTPEGEWWP